MRTLVTSLLLLSALKVSGQQSLGLDFYLGHGQVPVAIESAETVGSRNLLRAGVGMRYVHDLNKRYFLSMGIKNTELATLYDHVSEQRSIDMIGHYLGVPVGVGVYLKKSVKWEVGLEGGYQFERLTKLKSNRFNQRTHSSRIEIVNDEIDRNMHMLFAEFSVKHLTRKNLSTIFGISFSQGIRNVEYIGRRYFLNRINYRLGFLFDFNDKSNS